MFWKIIALILFISLVSGFALQHALKSKRVPWLIGGLGFYACGFFLFAAMLTEYAEQESAGRKATTLEAFGAAPAPASATPEQGVALKAELLAVALDPTRDDPKKCELGVELIRISRDQALPAAVTYEVAQSSLMTHAESLCHAQAVISHHAQVYAKNEGNPFGWLMRLAKVMV